MSVNTKKVSIFIFWAFFLNGVIGVVYHFTVGTLDSPWFVLVAMIGMFTPAAAALIAEKGISKKVFWDLGLRFKFNRWYFIAILVPILLVLAVIPLNSLVPGITLTDGLPYIESQLNDQMPQGEISQAMIVIRSMGHWFPVVAIVTSIIAALVLGPTINAIPALGEELGWRGLLQPELRPLGFWNSSYLVGIVWGLWHMPFILQGYNYPGYPLAGVGMMTLMTMLLSPIFTFFQGKGESVVISAMLHGTFNAIAGLPVLFVAGGNSLTTGVTGVAGLSTLVLANLILYYYRNNRLKVRSGEG